MPAGPGNRRDAAAELLWAPAPAEATVAVCPLGLSRRPVSLACWREVSKVSAVTLRRSRSENDLRRSLSVPSSSGGCARLSLSLLPSRTRPLGTAKEEEEGARDSFVGAGKCDGAAGVAVCCCVGSGRRTVGPMTSGFLMSTATPLGSAQDANPTQTAHTPTQRSRLTAPSASLSLG
jgi:hypothetical protein